MHHVFHHSQLLLSRYQNSLMPLHDRLPVIVMHRNFEPHELTEKERYSWDDVSRGVHGSYPTEINPMASLNRSAENSH